MRNRDFDAMINTPEKRDALLERYAQEFSDAPPDPWAEALVKKESGQLDRVDPWRSAEIASALYESLYGQPALSYQI